MSNKVTKLLQNSIFPILILGLSLYLAWINYIPDTFLSGWDTLHPEFNLSLYLKRSFFGVWQEHQGVGAVASQAHVAELPRLLITYLLSVILPLNLVRYSFFFVCLALGSLGVYFLGNYLLSKEELRYSKAAAFLASLFYVLNLTTVQQFYVPLEMFAVHFALLPWLFFTAIGYIREGENKYLIWFSLFSIFAASQAHTATLFYVYFTALMTYLAFVFLFKPNRSTLKKALGLTVITLILNAYWILPNIYYIKNHSEEVSSSKIHSIFTDEAFLQGKSYGNPESLALSKNFLFNWREFDFEKNTFVDLLDEWKEHLGKPYVREIGLAVFGIAMLGILLSAFSKSVYMFSFLPVLLICVFFWINANPPFEGIFNYLRDNFEIFREGLRFPFTKFSILLILTLSLYFAYTSAFIMRILSKLGLSVTYFLLAVGILVYFALPMFQGYLISPSMKVKIPEAYFEIFGWFNKKDPNYRVAKLPLQTYWGWNFHSWGYQGAGFTWFGIPQPTLDREFDRWSGYNETFYNEASFALYANDSSSFEKVLEKYQVRYLLLDESVINAGGSNDVLYISNIKSILNGSSRIKEVTKADFLTVYETDFNKSVNYISAPSVYSAINTDLLYTQLDPVYLRYGTYITSSEAPSFPFVNFDKRGNIKVSTVNGALVLQNIIQKATVSIPVAQRVTESFTQDRGYPEAFNCDLKKIGEVSKKRLIGSVLYKATGGGVSCDFYYYPDLSYSQGYALKIKGENKAGRSLKIYLQNLSTGRMDLEELLPKGKFGEIYFILPKSLEGEGFTVNVETRSFGKVASENILSGIEFVPIPYEYLTTLKLGSEEPKRQTNTLEILEVKKRGGGYYEVKTEGNGLLVLGQGYEPGWVAFSGWERLEHFKVNSWANGWIVPDGSSQLIILFWPQYLEYLGFLVLSLSFVIFAKSVKQKYVS